MGRGEIEDRKAFVQFDPGFESDEEISAENAVRTILDRGLFSLDADREFKFLWYASSVRELRDYFAMAGGYDETPASPRNHAPEGRALPANPGDHGSTAHRRPGGISGASSDLPTDPLGIGLPAERMVNSTGTEDADVQAHLPAGGPEEIRTPTCTMSYSVEVR
jgi:hypothetical protein